MKKIQTIEEISADIQQTIAGGYDWKKCDCSNVKCTCECDDKRQAPKAGTARENHKWEKSAVMGRTERNNF